MATVIPPSAVTIFDALVCAVVVVPFVLLARHRNAIPMLPGAREGVRLPRLVVVVPARDEAASIASAVGSLLKQDYPELAVVAVDDRSTDGTQDALRELAARDPRLEVLRVDNLPAGWLGSDSPVTRT